MVHYHDRDSWKSEFPEQIRDPGQSIPKIRDPGENEVKKSEIPEKIRDPGSTKNPSFWRPGYTGNSDFSLCGISDSAPHAILSPQ